MKKTVIYSKELFSKGLSAKELGVIRLLTWYRNNDTVSIHEIEKATGISHNTLLKYITSLVRKRILYYKPSHSASIVKFLVVIHGCYIIDSQQFFENTKHVSLVGHGILMWLLYYRNTKTNTTFVSPATIALKSGASVAHVYRTISSLTNLSILSRTNGSITFTGWSISRIGWSNSRIESIDNSVRLVNEDNKVSQLVHYNNIFNNNTIINNYYNKRPRDIFSLQRQILHSHELLQHSL